MNNEYISDIRNHLLNLPDSIRDQSLEAAKTAEQIEAHRLILEKKRNEYLSFVLSVAENGKPKFSNEHARRAAVEELIANDASYAVIHDSLLLEEALLKRQEIDLEHSHNLFRAYLALSQMQGVR